MRPRERVARWWNRQRSTSLIYIHVTYSPDEALFWCERNTGRGEDESRSFPTRTAALDACRARIRHDGDDPDAWECIEFSSGREYQ